MDRSLTRPTTDLPAPLRTLQGIEIDWPELQRLRPHTIVNEDVPPYLLLPEVRRLIEQAETFEKSIFYELLFVTGARIGEAMKLTPGDFFLDESNDLKTPHALVPTLKRRGTKSVKRLIHLEPEFVLRFRQFLGSIKRKQSNLLFPYSKRKLTKWFEDERPRHQFDIVLTPHTMRHSCAVHLVLLGYDIKFIQQYLGHKNLSSTQIYTAVALPLLQKVQPVVRFR